ncbi:MAG: response regulator [Bradymonadia bacterium]
MSESINARSEGQAPNHPYDILLVEDDDAAAALIVRGVASMGLKVKRVADGEHAILITQNNLPDLVLMDIMMPRLDGLETTRYLKMHYTGQLPVMVITAREDGESLRQAQASGVDDYMTKPVRISRLRERVGRLLSLGEAERKAASGDAEGIAQVVRLRLEIADELIEIGRAPIAQRHLERLMAIDAEHDGVKSLARKLDV